MTFLEDASDSANMFASATKSEFGKKLFINILNHTLMLMLVLFSLFHFIIKKQSKQSLDDQLSKKIPEAIRKALNKKKLQQIIISQ